MRNFETVILLWAFLFIYSFVVVSLQLQRPLFYTSYGTKWPFVCRCAFTHSFIHSYILQFILFWIIYFVAVFICMYLNIVTLYVHIDIHIVCSFESSILCTWCALRWENVSNIVSAIWTVKDMVAVCFGFKTLLLKMSVMLLIDQSRFCICTYG